MCGIAGVYGYTGETDSLRQRLSAMNRTMIRRGPDEEGLHVEPEMRSGMCVRRLSIVDPEHGSQPLFNEDHSVAVVCNGEIYNHRQLRRELEQLGHKLRSHSDCEVLAHLYEEEGVDFLNRLNGMFALAVLDRRRRSLLLARDPVGMKHLYWGRTAEGVAFASEARALFAAGFVAPQPDWDALGAYFSLGWVPSPGTPFRGLQCLRPGSYVLVNPSGIEESRYWVPRYREPEKNRSEQDYAVELKQLLEKAVGTHLDADVPAGLFLSGGWDSSLVALYASRQSDQPLKSYSLIFPDDPESDESHFSRQVARQTGTRSREIEVRDSDVLNAFEQTMLATEEPVLKTPATLHCILSQAAGSELKVVLGGQGSDELFGGYDWVGNSALHRLRRALPHRPFTSPVFAPLGPKWNRALRFLAARNDELAHMELQSWSLPKQLAAILPADMPFAGCLGPEAIALTDETRSSFRDVLDLQLSLELTGRLADAILFTDEKIAMAHSLEVRMPFLDLEVVEFAHRLPSRFKIRNGHRKAILASLACELPPEVSKRRKQPLHVPQRIYRSPALLSAYSETIMETSLSTGLFDHARLEAWVRRATSEVGYQAALLRLVFYFCLWWNRFIIGSSTPK